MLKKAKTALKNKNKKNYLSKLPISFKVDKKLKPILVLVTVVLVGGLIFYRFKHYFVVAVVGSKPITRYSFINELEKQGGKMVLEDMVSRQLVETEAANRNIAISQADLNKEIGNIEEQLSATGQTLDSVLELQGQTRADLIERVRLQMLLEKLLGPEVQVTEAEIEEYFDENQDFFPEDTSLEDVKEDIEDQLRRQKIAEKYPQWLNELKAKYNIRYFVDY